MARVLYHATSVAALQSLAYQDIATHFQLADTTPFREKEHVIVGLVAANVLFLNEH